MIELSPALKATGGGLGLLLLVALIAWLIATITGGDDD